MLDDISETVRDLAVFLSSSLSLRCGTGSGDVSEFPFSVISETASDTASAVSSTATWKSLKPKNFLRNDTVARIDEESTRSNEEHAYNVASTLCAHNASSNHFANL